MCQCPRCGNMAASNSFENVPFDHVASGALSALRAGRNAHAIGAMALWTLVETMNHFRATWKCPACRNRFG